MSDRFEFMISAESDSALTSYIDFCVSDANVRAVLDDFNVSREMLEDIYKNLMLNGLGQWVGGHFAAASTIAYAEPLTFVLASENLDAARVDVCSILLDYWSGKIPAGGLFRLINNLQA